MSRSPHVMILASAGSGKTYELTNRFIALLAAGAAPERIVALTFTRKAAGEFFDEILHKLARAATDEAAASRLAAALGTSGWAAPPAPLGRGDFLRLLRAMIDTMHRLRLGTLDSFFARVARSFPLELGLEGDFEILQEHAARMERRRVLRQMFARVGDRLAGAQTEFIEAFKRATFGAEEKQLGARLDAFLDRHQENFLAAPDAALWGHPDRIWKSGSRWLMPQPKLAESIVALRGALTKLSDGQRVRWEAFFAALEEWTPGGGPLPKPVEYVLSNALDVWEDLCGGQAAITIDRRKLPLELGGCRALEQVVTGLIGAELRRRLETTRGIFAVLRGYEANYHESVRRAGRLTFADVQRLLAPMTLTRRAPSTRAAPETERGGGEVAGGPVAQLELFSGEAADAVSQAGAALEADDEKRLLLDYRLDAEIDHWLLDEFQDTSFGQWSVLRNLIDEVVQDPEARRSFFCVGDVKQAIYAWREGDPRLFREIFDHYNAAAPGSIEERHLVASWRSGPALIEMVNAVFGAPGTLAELFPGDASATWNREWRDHRSAVPERKGQAALLHAANETERWELLRRLLDEIRPIERGLTGAVLVKKNETATAIAEFLRRSGIPAIADSDLHVATDNPIGAVLLALMQAAAHPGDTLAQQHLRMTPVGRLLEKRGLGTLEALTRSVLGHVHRDGFERTVGTWTREIERCLDPNDAFSRLRAREFAAAARLFDATGSRDVDEFIAFMERHSVRPPETAAAIRVMTIHKAKGLGFDVVFLPDLQGSRIDEPRDGLAVHKASDRSVEWVLDLPPRLFCAQDKVLAEYLEAAGDDACYENLSLLYVALTRAKRAMYVVTEPVGDSKSRNFSRLLAATLGETAQPVRVGALTVAGAWARGDSNWHLAPAAEPAVAVVPPAPRLAPIANGRAGLPRRSTRRPSAAPTGLALSAWFELGHSGALEFGTELHALFAEIEWTRPAEAATWARGWLARGHSAGVVAAAESCLRAPELTNVWRKPAGGGLAEVWRERAFEIVLDSAWITGVFDRVVVERDADGQARHATVYDFKTDRLAGEGEMAVAVARHREQLNTYRQVAAVLTGLPRSKVRGELVLTQIERCALIE